MAQHAKSIVLILLFFLFIANVNAALTDGTQAQWKMDENTGTVTYSSVNSYNGTFGTSSWTTGIVGSAINVSGGNWVTTKDIDMTSGLTVMCWVKVYTKPSGTGTSQYYAVVDKWYDGNRAWYFWLTGSGVRVGISRTDTGGAQIEQDLTTAYNTSQWFNMAMTWSASGNKAIIYINGVNTVNSTTGASKDLRQNNQAIIYGVYGGSTGYYRLNGEVDECVVFNVSKSKEEIQSIVLNESAGTQYPWSASVPNVTNSCTYTTGNWTINIVDNCNITTNIDMSRNTLIINGSKDGSNMWINFQNETNDTGDVDVNFYADYKFPSGFTANLTNPIISVFDGSQSYNYTMDDIDFNCVDYANSIGVYRGYYRRINTTHSRIGCRTTPTSASYVIINKYLQNQSIYFYYYFINTTTDRLYVSNGSIKNFSNVIYQGTNTNVWGIIG